MLTLIKLASKYFIIRGDASLPTLLILMQLKLGSIYFQKKSIGKAFIKCLSLFEN